MRLKSILFVQGLLVVECKLCRTAIAAIFNGMTMVDPSFHCFSSYIMEAYD